VEDIEHPDVLYSILIRVTESNVVCARDGLSLSRILKTEGPTKLA